MSTNAKIGYALPSQHCGSAALDTTGLKVSATPEMVSTLLQHAGIVQAPPLTLPVPRPAVDWTGVARVGLSTVEHFLHAIGPRGERPPSTPDR